MYDASCEILNPNSHRYLVTRKQTPVTRHEALTLWQDDNVFRTFFIHLLSESPFSAYRWETPPLTASTASFDFEFVLINSPGLSRDPDPQSFAKHFIAPETEEGVVSFKNLGKDSMLVVPTPSGPETTYVHLASFLRAAPEAQKHALWKVVGNEAEQQMASKPVWISTAGAGVAWLHVRLDSRPKYYGHQPYRIIT